MKEKENAIKLYEQQAREVWAMNAPMLQDGVKITVSDAGKYTDMKNGIMDKMLAINAPLLSEQEKLDVWASYSDRFDELIRDRGK